MKITRHRRPPRRPGVRLRRHPLQTLESGTRDQPPGHDARRDGGRPRPAPERTGERGKDPQARTSTGDGSPTPRSRSRKRRSTRSSSSSRRSSLTLSSSLFPNDTHQDHRVVAQATVTATRYVRNVLFYEVPYHRRFHARRASSSTSARSSTRRSRSLKAHKSQVFATRIADLSILEAARATALFRGVQNRVKYAEGFVPLRACPWIILNGL